MKRILLIPGILLLLVSSVYSYSPPFIEPDTAYLPALLDSTSHMVKNTDNGKWSGRIASACSYDIHGNLAREEGFHYDHNNTHRWEGSADEFTYDKNGNIIGLMEYYWDSYLKKWTDDRKEVHTIDQHGNTSCIVSFT